LRVAVTTVRLGQMSARKGPLALAVLMNTISLGRQLGEERVEVGAGHVRPRHVELRGAAVVTAVPDEHHEHQVVGTRPGAEPRAALATLPGGAAGHLLIAFGGRVHQEGQVLLRHAEPLRRLRQRGPPLVEGLAVLGIAREADDDEQEGMQHRATPSPYTSPTRRR
jgi:hypothetical protein